MTSSLPNRKALASVHFQEVEQSIDQTAETIVRFLGQGHGRVVDTSESDDDTRVIRVVGYDVSVRATRSAR